MGSLFEARRPRLLDLFCGAGGAAVGYARAGFEVVGVDIDPQSNYPFRTNVEDALLFLQKYLNDQTYGGAYDAIHASPPCQGYTTMRAPGQKGAPRLIAETRELLVATRLPYVIENVEGAHEEMRDPITVCGTMFGLGAQGHELRRHRLFESNVLFSGGWCDHTDAPVIGVYGGHARRRSAKHGGRLTKDSWTGGHRAAAAEAMGMDWATIAEMSEAIPPAYTEWIGTRLMRYVAVDEAIAA